MNKYRVKVVVPVEFEMEVFGRATWDAEDIALGFVTDFNLAAGLIDYDNAEIVDVEIIEHLDAARFARVGGI